VDGIGTKVRAHVPQASMHLYATDLSSKTHGRATFTRKLYRYEQMPPDAARKVIEDSAKERKEEEVEV
jgi:elongation factor G